MKKWTGWYSVIPHSQTWFPTLRAACLSWGLSGRGSFGKRVHDGVYWLTSAGHDVHLIRADKLKWWEHKQAAEYHSKALKEMSHASR